MAEGFVRVAPDSTGKYIRNIELNIRQSDGTLLTVEQQAITRVADDGTILDTMGWVETSRESYIRKLYESILADLDYMAGVLGAPFATVLVPPTVPLGE